MVDLDTENADLVRKPFLAMSSWKRLPSRAVCYPAVFIEGISQPGSAHTIASLVKNRTQPFALHDLRNAPASPQQPTGSR